jgi:hypothetical protein
MSEPHVDFTHGSVRRKMVAILGMEDTAALPGVVGLVVRQALGALQLVHGVPTAEERRVWALCSDETKRWAAEGAKRQVLRG